MSKVKLAANPTFWKKVDIPTPDGDLPIEFEFRHKSKSGLKEFQEGSAGREDIDIIMEIAAGWRCEDAEFSRESVEQLLDDRHAAAHVIVTTYLITLAQRSLGN